MKDAQAEARTPSGQSLYDWTGQPDPPTMTTMDTAGIVRFLETTSGPGFLSPHLQIVEENGTLLIQSPTPPLRLIGWWMGFVYLVAIGLTTWLQPGVLWLVVPMGPPAIIGFLLMMRMIEQLRVKAGPQAIIGRDIVNFSGATMLGAAATGMLEMYFRVRGGGKQYRVVFVLDGRQRLPILWQIGGRSRWTRPTLEDLAGRLGLPAESIDLPEKISPAPMARW